MELDELLESKKFWKALAAAFDEGRGVDWDGLDLVDRIRHEAVSYVIRRFFQEQVIEKLPRPRIVTAEELTNIAIQQLAGLPLVMIGNLTDDELRIAHPDVWIGKTRFLAFVNAAICHRLEADEDDQSFDLGIWGADEKGNVIAVVGVGIGKLWPHESKPADFSLYAERKYEVSGCRVEAWLVGSCTHGAMDLAVTELKPIIESIAKTAGLSATKQEGYDDLSYAINRDGINRRYSGAPLAYLCDGDGAVVFRECLDAYLCEGGSKTDINEQLASAVNCLLEADNQLSPGMALSQMFAAIEALICKGVDRKAETIGSYVPALLKPNSLGRRERGDILKAFYDLRSKVVHGSPVEVRAETCDAARRLAAGVIRAVIRWRAFQLRMKEPTTCQRFMNDLHFAAGDGKEVVQVGMDLSDLLPESVNPPSILDRVRDIFQ